MHYLQEALVPYTCTFILL